jgi:DNA-binding ferritin-like protein
VKLRSFLRKKSTQASEKAWGAASQMVKALAANEGKELRSHASLWEYVDELAERLRDVELRHLWGRTTSTRTSTRAGCLLEK